MTTPHEAYQAVVAALPAAARAVYGERLRALVLFGSVARGSERPDSDIDLLIVASPLPAGRFARVAEFEAMEARLEPELTAAQAAGAHPFLSPLIKTPEELEAGSPVHLDMPWEAKILWEREAAASGYFARLKAKLEAYGARRIPCTGGHYWLLKPDARPGEPIEL